MGEVLDFHASGESWLDRHRERFFDRKWLVSAKGHRYVRLASPDGRGATVTVFRTNDGWKYAITRSAIEGPFYARQAYASALEARAAAWDSLARLTERSKEMA